MQEKTTLAAVAAVLMGLGLGAVPSQPKGSPPNIVDSRDDDALPQAVARRSVAPPSPTSEPHWTATDFPAPAAPGGEIARLHQAALDPLRLAVEGAARPLIDHAMRSLGRGPERADWAGGMVMDAFERVLDRRAQAALMTREASPPERARGLGEVRLGDVVLVLAVHPSQRVDSIDRSRMRDVLRGSLTDWSQLGGEAGNIRLVLPTAGPTADIVARTLIAGDRLARTEDTLESDAARLEVVARDPRALAVVALATAEADSRVRMLAIDSQRPSLGAHRTGVYPFAFPIVLGYADPHDPKVVALLRDLQSAPGLAALGRVLSR